MAIKLTNKANVNAPDADFPFGDVRDKTPSEGGTKWNRETMSDPIQFFEKMMAEAGIIHNGTLDNEYGGWQLFEAFQRLTRPYKVNNYLFSQAGTATAPTVTEADPPQLGDPGDVVWTRTGAGTYKGTSIGAFPGVKQLFFGPSSSTGLWVNGSITDDEILVFTSRFDDTIPGWVLDDVGVSNLSIEVRSRPV